MQNQRHDEEGHIKNYSGKEAVIKLRELAESARVCMFTTFTKTKPLPSRPMALNSVADDGTLYFLSADSSNKNHEIENDSDVQLFFGNTGSSEYLSIFGKANISKDRNKIKELWTTLAKAWFQEGPEDPAITVISVKPQVTEYWDTKHNKMVSLLKIAASIVTGKTMDDGVEGALSI